MTLLNNFKKAIRNPKKAGSVLSQLVRETLFWDSCFQNLPEPKTRGFVPAGPELQDALVEQLVRQGFKVEPYTIDVEGYHRYLQAAQYDRDKYGQNTPEKTLEHYLATSLLGLSDRDVYIDIANDNSPVPEIYHRLYGCDAFRQDLIFPPGLHGKVIGGDAGNLPLPDEFCSKMALHCSFEHFEQDSDTRFIREAGRVLTPGGKLCIAPLYLFDRYAIQTDPSALPRGGIAFEKDALLYGARGYRNRHGRFYDVPHLKERIESNLNTLELTIYSMTNAKEIDPSCYICFAALFEKRREK